ncbi:MAG: hypothetical protein PVG30_02515 [Gammaproteobacteria bacterium]|jgi:hypothetical protein
MCFCEYFFRFFKKRKINYSECSDIPVSLQKKYKATCAKELLEKLMQEKKCKTYEELLGKIRDRMEIRLYSKITLSLTALVVIFRLIEEAKLKIESQKNNPKPSQNILNFCESFRCRIS